MQYRCGFCMLELLWRYAGGEHSYAKVDIMLKYKNKEKKGSFHGEACTGQALFSVSKQQISRKRVCFLG